MSDHDAANNQGKTHFMLWSTPLRTTFRLDMTVEERSVMLEHIAYWTEKQNQGIVLVFGPVLKPEDPHGLAVIEVEQADQVPQLIAADPAVIAGLMTTACYPMMATLPK